MLWLLKTQHKSTLKLLELEVNCCIIILIASNSHPLVLLGNDWNLATTAGTQEKNKWGLKGWELEGIRKGEDSGGKW